MWAYRSLWVFCSQGFRLLAALAIAHPRLGFAVGTEMALQLMSLAKGVLGPIFFNLPSLDVLCGGGGVVAQRFGVRVRVVRVILPARADRRAVGGLDYTRCIGSHYLSPGPVSVRMCPAVHGVFCAGVVPAPQLGWSREL